jgi:hypothetical protein
VGIFPKTPNASGLLALVLEPNTGCVRKTDENLKLTDIGFEGAIYGGPGVVQDRKIITSGVSPFLERVYGMQGGTVQLTQAFIKAIGPQ